jgi:hypothetical protein
MAMTETEINQESPYTRDHTKPLHVQNMEGVHL